MNFKSGLISESMYHCIVSVKGALISEGIFTLVPWFSKNNTYVQNYCPKILNLGWKVVIALFFEDWTKVEIPSEIKHPFFTVCRKNSKILSAKLPKTLSGEFDGHYFWGSVCPTGINDNALGDYAAFTFA